MNPATLRQLWVVIEETQTPALLRLSDADLIQQLLRQFTLRQSSTLEEFNTITQYLHTRTSLIRDIAQTRVAAYFHEIGIFPEFGDRGRSILITAPKPQASRWLDQQ